MNEATFIGDFTDGTSPRALTSVDIELRALELVVHWRRCGLTADWLALFFAYDFEPQARQTAESILSTVINELLENAAKFCADKQRSVRIAVRHHGDFVSIETLNAAAGIHATTLRQTIEELTRADLDELFARRMQTKNTPGASGIGLLILKKDYAVRLGAKLTPIAGDEWNVEVRVDLSVGQVEPR
jgi:hypothetical protein